MLAGGSIGKYVLRHYFTLFTPPHPHLIISLVSYLVGLRVLIRGAIRYNVIESTIYCWGSLITSYSSERHSVFVYARGKRKLEGREYTAYTILYTQTISILSVLKQANKITSQKSR